MNTHRNIATILGLMMIIVSCLMVALIGTSCSYPYWDIANPDDPDPVDTIAEPIIVADTCGFLIPIDTPAFTLLSTWFFNGVPGFFEWHYENDPIGYLSLVNLMEA